MSRHRSYTRLSCSLDFGFGLTLFGYQLSLGFDLSEWHFTVTHFESVGYLVYVGPFSFEVLDAASYVEPVDPLIAKLQDEVFEAEKETAKYYSALKDEKEAHEQTEVRLAGCGVAAQGYGEKMEPTTYGYSASYEDVYNLRIKYNQALKEIDKLRKKSGGKNDSKSVSTGKSRRKS